VDEETAELAAPNAHDFVIAIGKALKERAVEERAAEERAAEAPEEEPAGEVVSVSPSGSAGAEGLGFL
jgi:hypothetical protein